jgi:hypothetical protein
MSAGEARTRFATMQAEVVRALTEQGTSPRGFDLGQLRAAALALAAKRAQAVVRAWPALARDLGKRFEERFAAFATTMPLPREGGPLADGRAFIRWLAQSEDLSEEARLRVLAVDLRCATKGGGLVRRSGPAVAAAVLRRPHRLVLALRLPWIGERWLSLPLCTWRARFGL